MKKIIDFFKIKKNDELIFYKILAWIILLISVWSIFEEVSEKVQDYIADSKKEELVFKIDSIQSSNTSLEVYAKTNLPNGTEVSMFAKPVEGLDKLGFSESGLGVTGFSKVRDGKIHIKFQGLGKPGKEYVICKTPYEIDASIHLGDSFKTYDDFEKKYKENDNIEVNNSLESISYPLGEYEIKNGLSLSEYKKYCADEQSNRSSTFFKEYLSEHYFTDATKVSYNDPKYSINGKNRVIIEGTVIDKKIDNLDDNISWVNIFIKLNNGQIVDLRQYKNDIRGVFEEGKIIKSVNIDDIEKGSYVKAYGLGLGTNGVAYLNGEYRQLNKTVVNTGADSYETYDCPNMYFEYIELINNDKPSNQNQESEYGEGDESFEGGDRYHRELYSRAKAELLAINNTKLMKDYLNNNLNIDSMYDYHRELSELKNISTSWADTLWGERDCSNKADIEKEKEERLYISKIVSSLEPTITTVDHYNDGYMSIEEDQVLNEIKTTMKIVNTNLNKINNIKFIN